jgi:hypothetical protein
MSTDLYQEHERAWWAGEPPGTLIGDVMKEKVDGKKWINLLQDIVLDCIHKIQVLII